MNFELRNEDKDAGLRWRKPGAGGVCFSMRAQLSVMVAGGCPGHPRRWVGGWRGIAARRAGDGLERDAQATMAWGGSGMARGRLGFRGGARTTGPFGKKVPAAPCWQGSIFERSGWGGRPRPVGSTALIEETLTVGGEADHNPHHGIS